MPIHVETDDRVMRVTIEGYNAHNPITQSMYLELQDAFIRYERTRNLEVMLIKGAGDKHFSVGGNLKIVDDANNFDFYDRDRTMEMYWYLHSYDPMMVIDGPRRLADVDVMKPVVAAVRGYCLGAALMLLGQKTDIRIASETAEFGFTEIRRGMGGAAAIVSKLRYQIPYTALMWLNCGQHIKAQAALNYGLVNEVVPDDQLEARAEEIVAAILEVPALAIRAEKMATIHTQDLPYKESVEYAKALSAMTRMSDECREATNAFVEKRKPNFTPKVYR